MPLIGWCPICSADTFFEILDREKEHLKEYCNECKWEHIRVGALTREGAERNHWKTLRDRVKQKMKEDKET